MKKTFYFLFMLLFLPINVFAFQDSARSTLVMDMDSGRVLYKKDAHNKRLIASITKIMTAIVAIENGHLDSKVTVGREVLDMYGTNIYVEVGEKIKVKDLLYGLILRSGNDASIVLSKKVSGNENKFVELMNSKAHEIGMKNTSFKNPHGLDEKTKNYSTAYDMALLSKYAYKNKIYRKITSKKIYKTSTGKKTYLWYNKNKLLNIYKHCTGGKNGYTPKAGKTLVTTASKNNLNITIVSLDDSNSYVNHKKMYEYFFKKYKKYEIISKNKFRIDENFYNGGMYIKKSFYYPLSNEEKDNIRTVVYINKNSTNNKIGRIIIYLYKKEIGSVNIYRKK